MYSEARLLRRTLLAVMLATVGAGATSLPRLSFEELADRSDLIVSGNVMRSWSAWDANHRYIWTHYLLTVAARHKGVAAATVEIAEPGGVVDGVGMSIAGTVRYTPGEKVLVFAQRMANGYLRTTGWAQGKYGLDRSGLLHADSALRDEEIVETAPVSGRATHLRTLEGMSERELDLRVAARLRAISPGITK